MDELLGEFIAETREMMDALQGEIVAWEADPADRARLDSIFRFVHTVKGNCGFFDFPQLAALSHAAEDALADVRSGQRRPDPALVDAVLAIIDRVAAMMADIEAGTPIEGGDDSALIDALAPGGATVERADEGNAASHAPQAAVSSGAAAAQRSVRIPVGLMDSLMSAVSDMVLARNETARRLSAAEVQPEARTSFDRLSAILADVREHVTRMRMQRLDPLFRNIPRVVRDLAQELDKQVLVDIDPGDVELDREIIEMIRDPLMHIVRNAVDHGIEPPSARLAAGKRETGVLSVCASQSGNQVEIQITDDGKGIDAERLVARAVAAGIIGEAEGHGMPRDMAIALMFEPGLSTARSVTAVSGRGVGMDVVRANIEKAGGTIAIASTPGTGTAITLRLPMTLSIMPALTVSLAGQIFAIPRAVVEEIVRPEELGVTITELGQGCIAHHRGMRLPCVVLGEVLGLGNSSTPPGDGALVIVKLNQRDHFAIAVDRVLDHQELVVKPLSRAVLNVGLYCGSSLLDDGQPLLMLDAGAIVRAAGIDFTQMHAADAAEEREHADSRTSLPVMLFTGLDRRLRAIRMNVVRRVETFSRADLRRDVEPPQAVIGDAILPLAGLEGGRIPRGNICMLRLPDGHGEVGLVVREVLDVANIDGEIARSRPGSAIEGTAMVNGRSVELVDAYYLFATLGSAGDPAKMPVCRLPESDPWFANFLRPLVESAGYRVVGEGDADKADLAFAPDPGTKKRKSVKAANTVWLRDTADDESGDARSVYRYDRLALLAALHAVRKGAAT